MTSASLTMTLAGDVMRRTLTHNAYHHATTAHANSHAVRTAIQAPGGAARAIRGVELTSLRQSTSPTTATTAP